MTWNELTTLARQAPPVADAVMPLGFATRILFRQQAVPASVVWQWLSIRAVAGAAVIALICLAINVTRPTPQPDMVDEIFAEVLQP